MPRPPLPLEQTDSRERPATDAHHRLGAVDGKRLPDGTTTCGRGVARAASLHASCSVGPSHKDARHRHARAGRAVEARNKRKRNRKTGYAPRLHCTMGPCTLNAPPSAHLRESVTEHSGEPLTTYPRPGLASGALRRLERPATGDGASPSGSARRPLSTSRCNKCKKNKNKKEKVRTSIPLPASRQPCAHPGILLTSGQSYIAHPDN